MQNQKSSIVNHKSSIINHQSQGGFALITVLLLMVIVSLLGVIAINTSIVDIQISGNTRRSATAFQGAEAGTDLSVSVIENTIATNTLTPSQTGLIITTLDTENLETEILAGTLNPDTPAVDPDIVMDIGNNPNKVNVKVDIDRLYSYAIEGGAQAFAMGYEGVGMGVAGGGIGILYSIDSEGSS